LMSTGVGFGAEVEDPGAAVVAAVSGTGSRMVGDLGGERYGGGGDASRSKRGDGSLDSAMESLNRD
jgi:hypothetical protein